MCLVVVFVVFVHAYQVTPQWKAYDDIFRGRTNAAEIPLVLYLFALISITWLWGGLHMAYRQLWMLVFFIIFNSLQVRADFWSFGPLGGSPPPLLNAHGISAWPAEQNPETNSGLRVTHWRC
eukprot:XP_027302909.1 G-protein coupled receptor 98-like [Anas platyrhynchos]